MHASFAAPNSDDAPVNPLDSVTYRRVTRITPTLPAAEMTRTARTGVTVTVSLNTRTYRIPLRVLADPASRPESRFRWKALVRRPFSTYTLGLTIFSMRALIS